MLMLPMANPIHKVLIFLSIYQNSNLSRKYDKSVNHFTNCIQRKEQEII